MILSRKQVYEVLRAIENREVIARFYDDKQDLVEISEVHLDDIHAVLETPEHDVSAMMVNLGIWGHDQFLFSRFTDAEAPSDEENVIRLTNGWKMHLYVERAQPIKKLLERATISNG